MCSKKGLSGCVRLTVAGGDRRSTQQIMFGLATTACEKSLQCGRVRSWRELTWGRGQIQNALLHESEGHLLQKASAD